MVCKKKFKFQRLSFYLAEEVWHAPIFFPTQAAAEHSISGAHFGSHPSLGSKSFGMYSCIRQPPFSFKETSHFMNLMEHVEIVNFRRSVNNSMNAASRSMPSVERSLELNRIRHEERTKGYQTAKHH